MEKPFALEAKKLEVVYNHVSTAIQGVSFAVRQKEIFAIIGGNGAGKTTTLRAVSGFLGADSAEITDGEVFFEGNKINGLSPHKIANEGIVLVPERKKIFETLTIVENLKIAVPRSGESKLNEEAVYEYFPHLKAHQHTLAGFVSGGEAQMLAIGQAILCLPRVLMIDELSMGLAPLIVSNLMKTIVSLKNDLDLSVLLVEQNAAAALAVADHAAVMENGRIVFAGTPQKLMEHEDVREFYLGLKGTGKDSYRDVKQYRRKRRWWG